MSIDWTQQLSTHARWLRNVVRCRLGNDCEADDVLQEVALAVLPHPNAPTEPEQVAPWLYRLTLRKVINLRRSLGRKRRMLTRLQSETPSTTSDLSDPVAWVLNEESCCLMRQALERLPMEYRELLMLKYTEGWSYRQLAAHLGATEKTIEYRLLRARKLLAIELRDGAEDQYDRT